MRDWRELDEQWRQRSEQMFQRCVKEPDITKARLAWEAACLSEKKRLEWKCLYLQQEISEEKCSAFAALEGEYSFFTIDGTMLENLFQQVYPPGLGLIASKVRKNQNYISEKASQLEPDCHQRD
jgi:hypothetical protein